ncbi:MAG: hypothetical protein RL660_1218 [Bacteroidota bacterium]|jgi:hypothetical protein
MKSINEIIKHHLSCTFQDEDGDDLSIILNQPLQASAIDLYEKTKGYKLPPTLRELLLYTNGLTLFSVDILALKYMQYYRSACILAMHEWGNGDFTCVSLGGDYPAGAVLFMEHSEDNLTLIHSSIEEWVLHVIQQVEQLGVYQHPMDSEQGEVIAESDIIDPSNTNEELNIAADAISLSSILALMDNPILQKLESEIATAIGAKISFEIRLRIAELEQKQVALSKIPIEQIVEYTTNFQNEILDFSKRFLGNKPNSVLSGGFSIRFSIYLLYLRKADSTGLQTYLKRLQMPGVTKFVKELQAIYNAIQC